MRVISNKVSASILKRPWAFSAIDDIQNQIDHERTRILNNQQIPSFKAKHKQTADMPKFVLHYFDARGRGEPARLLFAVAGIPFQDRRISQEEWPTIKPSMFIACFVAKFVFYFGYGSELSIRRSLVIACFCFNVEIAGGTLPYLEVDGVGITQSMVIYRHLARLFGNVYSLQGMNSIYGIFYLVNVCLRF